MATDTSAPVKPTTSRAAVISLVLAILSVFLPSLFLVGAVVSPSVRYWVLLPVISLVLQVLASAGAVVYGVLALGLIKRSWGALGGRAIALTAMIAAPIALLVWIGAGLAL